MNTTIDTMSHEGDKDFHRCYNKAFYYQAKGELPLAIAHYQKALEYDAKHLPTLQILAFLLHQIGNYPLAINYYHRALALHPHSHSLQLAIANCFEKTNDLLQAKLHYEQAIELRQDYAVALNNYGNVCRKLGLLDIAEESLLNALRLKISVETLGNLGLLMYEKRQYSLAESFYDHALRLEPDNLQIKWNKGLLYLSQKKFSKGWDYYDIGLMAGTRPRQVSPQVTSNADYSLNYFAGKNIHIHYEQGIGDEIMFASCYGEIIDVAKQCTIECDDRLAPLFQRSFNKAHIIAKSETLFTHSSAPGSIADCYISAASIPRFLRRSASDFPVQQRYFSAYGRAAKLWKQRFNSLGDGLKIGISWRGGSNEETRKRSSTLDQWHDVFTTPHCHFINLQYGNVKSELDSAPVTIHEWEDTDHYHNLEQLAAQIASLDLVITVSNVTAHLAGALGIPVWVMLPYSPNWRWFEGVNPSLWYASAKLFRQSSYDDWDSVMRLVSQELHNKTSELAKPASTANIEL